MIVSTLKINWFKCIYKLWSKFIVYTFVIENLILSPTLKDLLIHKIIEKRKKKKKKEKGHYNDKQVWEANGFKKKYEKQIK